MRALAGSLAAGAILASTAWTAAVPPPPVADESLAVSTLTGNGFPMRVVGPLGEQATLPAPPKRIVSIALSSDELLLELVRPDRLAGLTYLVDDPTTTLSQSLAPRSAARVTEEAPEALLSLLPDLVVTAGYTRAEPIVLLDEARVPVFGIGTLAGLDDVLRAIATLGAVVGEPDRADALARSLRTRMQAVRERPAPLHLPRVLVWEGGFTYGAGTMPDDLVRRAGGVDAAASAGLRGPVPITEEGALALDPDIVVVPTQDASPRWHDASLVGDAAVWGAVRAVRGARVYGVPRAWIGSVSHHAVRALEALADIVRDERAP